MVQRRGSKGDAAIQVFAFDGFFFQFTGEEFHEDRNDLGSLIWESHCALMKRAHQQLPIFAVFIIRSTGAAVRLRDLWGTDVVINDDGGKTTWTYLERGRQF